MPFIQGALFVSITAGTDLARDIETGFLNRLALTPLRGEALLVGQLGGALVVGVHPGGRLPARRARDRRHARERRRRRARAARALDPDRVRASRASAGCWRCGSAPARRSRAIFPLLFVTLFLSSSSLPRNLIKADWFRDVATYNPVSYLIEGLRSLVITGWDAQALALGFGFAIALPVIALGLSRSAMKTRLVRT